MTLQITISIFPTTAGFIKITSEIQFLSVSNFPNLLQSGLDRYKFLLPDGMILHNVPVILSG